MNRLKEIKELKALAEELQLENREIIRKYKITELASEVISKVFNFGG